ncbi:MAG: 2-methylisocitrate lyase [Robiginitomaculum sp.]|nr:MAG: 2-methylisocitrate lyase [Robiginitomaculum sp.]
MSDQIEKAAIFKALHERKQAFIIGNAWDAGSARLLELAGYEAIATTSAGFAFAQNKQDNHVGRDGILGNASAIVEATGLPVSADLEDGFGTSEDACAKTINQAAKAGLVGGSIEDSTYDKNKPLYDLGHAIARIEAAVSAARALPFAFTLTARAENFLVGRPDISDVITRLQAYQEAGADVLYAPGLSTEQDIRSLCACVDRPVNVLALPCIPALTFTALADMGVQRISVGSTFARQAYGDLLAKSKSVLETGTFAAFTDAMPYAELSEKFEP